MINGEQILTRIQNDPGEMTNLLGTDSKASFELAGRPLPQIEARLNALMMVLKTCKGKSCYEPWHDLHPDGDVLNLIDSLDDRFDAFYETQPKVSFSKCEVGYIPESEGPMDFIPFNGQGGSGGLEWEQEMKRLGAPIKFRYQGEFSLWT